MTLHQVHTVHTVKLAVSLKQEGRLGNEVRCRYLIQNI